MFWFISSDYFDFPDFWLKIEIWKTSTLGLHKEILYSPYHRVPLINTRNKKDGTLDSPSILISFSNTSNKVINFSTGRMNLAHVANNQAIKV